MSRRQGEPVKTNSHDCRLPRVKDRRGRCYELAYKGVMRAPSWTLVHGCFECDGARLGHAWLLRDGEIFCPTFDRVFDESEYYAKHHTVPLVTYTVMEAVRFAVIHKHYGPWLREDELLVGIDRRKG